MSLQDGGGNDGVVVVESRKKKVRGGHKAHLTKMFNEIDTLLLGRGSGRDERLCALRECLLRKAGVISVLDNEIFDEVEPDTIPVEVEEAEETQTAIQEKIVKIDRALGVKKKPLVAATTGNTSSNSTTENSDTSVSSTSAQFRHMKLPKYEIKFDGDPKKYRTFKDSFEVAVDNNTALSSVEKFTYLQSFLEGDASIAIQGLDITAENYDEAKEILEERFGNKQVIVNSHMEELVKIPPVVKTEDVKGLRLVHDKIEIHLRSLRTLEVDPETHGMLLIPLLKRKLPSDINLILSRKFDSNDELWKIADLMKELKREVEARERSQTDSSKDSKAPTKRPPTFPPTTEGLIAHPNSTKFSCPFCNQKHYPDKCRNVTDPARRKAILMEKKRCFVCTREGHSAGSPKCSAKRMCMSCGGKHHTSICTTPRKVDETKANEATHPGEDKKEAQGECGKCTKCCVVATEVKPTAPGESQKAAEPVVPEENSRGRYQGRS